MVLRISRAASGSAEAVSEANIEVLATAVMNLSRGLGGEAQSFSRRELRESLDGLVKARKGSSVLLRAQALLVNMERDVGARKHATELLEQAVAASPSDGDAKLALGRAYLEQERFRQAIVHLEEAVRVLLDYKRAAARTYLALALERDGQFERAVRVRSELSAQ
jgi:Flp pilus assembly protein TadD